MWNVKTTIEIMGMHMKQPEGPNRWMWQLWVGQAIENTFLYTLIHGCDWFLREYFSTYILFYKLSSHSHGNYKNSRQKQILSSIRLVLFIECVGFPLSWYLFHGCIFPQNPHRNTKKKKNSFFFRWGRGGSTREKVVWYRTLTTLGLAFLRSHNVVMYFFPQKVRLAFLDEIYHRSSVTRHQTLRMSAIDLTAQNTNILLRHLITFLKISRFHVWIFEYAPFDGYISCAKIKIFPWETWKNIITPISIEWD